MQEYNQIAVAKNTFKQLNTPSGAANNKLTVVPSSLGAIKSLQHLDLSDNLLTALPQSLQHLQELVSLDVHGNKIIALPTTLCHLKMLQKLECGNNCLEEPGQTIALQVRNS